jgi:hypothetical protein
MSSKDAYVEKLHAKIDEWNADIDKLIARADLAKAESKIEYHRQIDQLKQKRRTIEEQLAEINRAGDDAWEDIKSGIDLAWKALNEAIASARSRFK